MRSSNHEKKWEKGNLKCLDLLSVSKVVMKMRTFPVSKRDRISKGFHSSLTERSELKNSRERNRVIIVNKVGEQKSFSKKLLN